MGSISYEALKAQAAEIVTAEERVREKITDEVQVRGGRLETSLADKVADAMKNSGEQ